MRISILQTDIVWENKQENLRRLREKLETLRGTTEIVVLPETFSTGFSMDTASFGRTHNGRNHRNTAPMVRRVPACSCRQLYCLRNSLGRRKAILLQPRILPSTPEGNAYYYDKRHLFRMGHETEHFTPGNRRPIIRYRGRNILLLVQL